jgi:hypothetical protein
MTTRTAPACISSFTGKYRFLSNFSELAAPIPLWGQIWRTSEHAYQAGKTTTPDSLRWIRDAPTAGEAKRRGRQVTIRPDWEQIKRMIMLEVVSVKFGHPDLRAQLVATGSATLIEGNHWGDDYWGAVASTRNPAGRLWPTRLGAGDATLIEGDTPGIAEQLWGTDDGTYLAGRNWLGRILMVVRELTAPEA